MKKHRFLVLLLTFFVLSLTGCSSKSISFDEAIKEIHSIQKELILTDMTLESAKSKVLDIIASVRDIDDPQKAKLNEMYEDLDMIYSSKNDYTDIMKEISKGNFNYAFLTMYESVKAYKDSYGDVLKECIGEIYIMYEKDLENGIIEDIQQNIDIPSLKEKEYISDNHIINFVNAADERLNNIDYFFEQIGQTMSKDLKANLEILKPQVEVALNIIDDMQAKQKIIEEETEKLAEEEAKRVAEQEMKKYEPHKIVDSNGKQIWKIYISDGSFHFKGTYKGSGNFIVKLSNSNQELLDVLANEIGDYIVDKTIIVPYVGWYYLEIYGSQGNYNYEW